MKLKAARRSPEPPEKFQDSFRTSASSFSLHLQKILVPVDFSECSGKALQYAAALAEQFRSEILLLHVVVFMPPPPNIMMMESEALTGNHQESGERLSAWAKKISSLVSAKTAVRLGLSAHQEIVDAARENRSDLIVIGNQGRTALARMWMGSTAERVVRQAPCPVLVIRDKEHEFLVKEKKTGELQKAA